MAGMGGCYDCGPGCNTCGPDAGGWNGVDKKQRADEPGIKVPDPVAGGQAMSRGKPMAINFQPPSSYGYNQSQNRGSSQGMNQSTNRSGSYVDPTMKGIYDQLLGMNVQNYGNVLGMYNQGQNELRGNLGGLYAQQPGLTAGVMNTMGMGQVLGQNGNWGVAAPAAQAIGDTFAQNQANTMQQMRRSGLGNTTALGNAQTQNAAQAGRAYGALGADLAGRAAGMQSELGRFNLGQQLSGAGMQADAAWRAAGDAARINFGNTAGNLFGNYSTGSSFGMNNSQNMGSSMGENWQRGAYEMPGYGDGGLYGGQGQNPFADPNMWAMAANGAGGGMAGGGAGAAGGAALGGAMGAGAGFGGMNAIGNPNAGGGVMNPWGGGFGGIDPWMA